MVRNMEDLREIGEDVMTYTFKKYKLGPGEFICLLELMRMSTTLHLTQEKLVTIDFPGESNDSKR